MSQFFSDSIFWIEIEKVKPNPYQPRHEFDQDRLRDLAESIRMYGILQPLVVTRGEVVKEDGGLAVEYELISGERRLRASKLAGLTQVPVIIRSGQEDSRVKLELAIIENLQREDLNPVDRARAFQRLVDEFSFKHIQIAEKVGKSREYVSNSLRLLTLPEEILNALSEGKISEGHARPLMMLTDRPEEQQTLYKEIIFKKLTVREAEAIARKIAYDKVRKKDRAFDPEIVELEEKLTESLGTRVHIERKDNGGKVMIDFFSNDDLRTILTLVQSNMPKKSTDMMEKFISQSTPLQVGETHPMEATAPEELAPVDDRAPVEKQADADSEELYSVKNFSI
jgi:ParB family chromosome partitioning protein